MRISRVALWLAALVFTVSSLPMTNSFVASAQGSETADQAIRSVAADALGVDPGALVVRLIAESGDWVYASATAPAGADDAIPTFRYLLAHNDGSGWIAELRYTDAFNALLAQAPPDFPNPSVRSALDGINLAGDGSADLSFPFPVGETWRFNGPHPMGLSGGPWSSLDFYRITGGGISYNAPIVAMRGGVVDRPCANMVVIDHGDGWSTVYYHVINIAVSDGQTVSRNQQIGGTSAEFGCGGAADGAHVHVGLTWHDSYVALDGKDIGGWTISNGSRPYSGCLTRGTTVLCADDYDGVTNDGISGSVGAVSISPTRTTVNNWVNWQVSGLPASSTGRIEWERLSGSTIDIGTFTTNSAGSASGQFRVPATPGGPNQLISFIVGSSTLSTTFEVAPRIKVLTNPGTPGQKVNVSLRGYAKQESVRIRWYRPNVGWIHLGTITTSNTGSSNIQVTVPWWAPDGQNSVRGDGTVFRQQTNAVYIVGGMQLAAEPTPASNDMATPEPDVEETVEPEGTVEAPTPAPEETPITIDRSALPVEPPTITIVVPEVLADPITGELVVTLDLGGPHDVSTIGWLMLDPACTPVSRIEWSTDGANWTALEPLPPAAAPGVWNAITPHQTASLVRWVLGATDPVAAAGCIAEVSAWATPAQIEPTPVPTEPPSDVETGTPAPASEEASD